MRTFEVTPILTSPLYGRCKKVVVHAGTTVDVMLIILDRVEGAKLLGRSDHDIADIIRDELDMSLKLLGMPISDDLEFLMIYTEIFH